jgi:hypothetical protein
MKLFQRCPRCNKLKFLKFSFTECSCSFVDYSNCFSQYSYRFIVGKHIIYVNTKYKYSQICWRIGADIESLTINLILKPTITEENLNKLVLLV